ncbi:MAG TPA: amidohydrolase family protein [Acidimicrobiales bacterium]|jgi:predicted amidohydrolase YtcJ|nr:amidohydrolase family protein [Acidimicrobiales bacterium]
MPSFTDHHVHFLASAAARLSVDVTPARSPSELVELISAAAPAGSAPAGSGWVRAWGYDDSFMTPARHPTRLDLDGAVPGRPVVVHHRSGHAAVLNSAALAEIGEPDHPDGVLFDRHDLLDRVPRLDPDALATAAAQVSREWWRDGITAFTDATHTNGPGELDLMSSWRAAGIIRQEVTAMVGRPSIGAVPGFGAMAGTVRVGPVKLMAPAPGPVAAAHAAGYPVAVHVVDVDALEATIDALAASPAPDGTVDRIEHAALSLPDQVARVAAIGAMVVVNPSFLVHRRTKYERDLSDVERPWMIRIGSWLRAGITVRAGSDSPVVPARPHEMIQAATAHPFDSSESITRAEAAGLLAP